MMNVHCRNLQEHEVACTPCYLSLSLNHLKTEEPKLYDPSRSFSILLSTLLIEAYNSTMSTPRSFQRTTVLDVIQKLHGWTLQCVKWKAKPQKLPWNRTLQIGRSTLTKSITTSLPDVDCLIAHHRFVFPSMNLTSLIPNRCHALLQKERVLQ